MTDNSRTAVELAHNLRTILARVMLLTDLRENPTDPYAAILTESLTDALAVLSQLEDAISGDLDN